eukprot:m.77797 g.77797  ORF g.77797 m.77797 type:complete len:426 (+) comp25053_c0_seq1:44-1321(+)
MSASRLALAGGFFLVVGFLLFGNCDADVADDEKPKPPDPLDTPPSFWHQSTERYEELLGLKEGDVSPSTGRILTSTGRFNSNKADIDQWGSAPTPTRKYDYHNHHLNSDKWDFCYTQRPGDVVIATAYKSGTTWMQTIVGNLIFKGQIPDWDNEELDHGVLDMAPWLDMRLPPPPVVTGLLEAQTHRRFIKTHLPLDALPYYNDNKYIHVTRDLRDVSYSWHNHFMKSQVWPFLNALPGRLGPALPMPSRGEGYTFTAKDLFLDFVADDTDSSLTAMWSYYHNLATWWKYRHLPNILHIHYNDLKRDPRKEIKRIADFLELDSTDEEIDQVVFASSFEEMKKHSEKIMGPMFSAFFDTGDGVPGSKNFIYKGTNGRWKDELTQTDNSAYVKKSHTRLPADGVAFLLNGFKGVEEHLSANDDKDEL